MLQLTLLTMKMLNQARKNQGYPPMPTLGVFLPDRTYRRSDPEFSTTLASRDLSQDLVEIAKMEGTTEEVPQWRGTAARRLSRDERGGGQRQSIWSSSTPSNSSRTEIPNAEANLRIVVRLNSLSPSNDSILLIYPLDRYPSLFARYITDQPLSSRKSRIRWPNLTLFSSNSSPHLNRSIFVLAFRISIAILHMWHLRVPFRVESNPRKLK